MRKDFPEAVKRAALKRADGRCEGCGDPLIPQKYHFDHIIADGLTGPPTLDNCQVLCAYGCHREKTAADVAHIAKAKRREAIQLNVKADKPPIGRRQKPPRTITKPALKPRPMFVEE